VRQARFSVRGREQASAMLNVSHEESVLLQQDPSAKGKSEEGCRTMNNSLKLGGGKDFPYDLNLEGMTVAEHERIFCSWRAGSIF